MAEVAQVGDAQTVAFEDEDDVPAALGALDLVVEAVKAMDAHTAHRARRAIGDHPRLALQGLDVVVVVVIVAAQRRVGARLAEGVADGSVEGVDDDGGAVRVGEGLSLIHI